MLFQEFQAVVLAAGKGSRMPEITIGKPKCLLPIGNKPLVWYPLYKLQQLGFNEVILIVAENQKTEIQTTLDKTDLHCKIDYFVVNDDIGTADSLRLVGDKLKSDVLIVSCDLVTDVNFRGVLELFRKHNASVCTLLFNPGSIESVTVPGPKAKYKPERDLIGIDAQTNRLVFLASASDFETDISLPRALLRKHTNIAMHSNLVDSHVYVLKNWIVKYLMHESSISTIKGELLPHIIRKQLLKPTVVTQKVASVVNNIIDKSDIFHFVQESDLDLLIQSLSTFNDHYGDLKPCFHGDTIRCFAYVASPDTFGIRVNTLHAYCSINANIIDKWEKITNGKEFVHLDSKSEVLSSQVDPKTVVLELAKLHEKTSYKSSIIGNNTEVQSFSRVFNSILMNNVVIKERVALENCIVCNGAVIETGSHLKNCLIGSNHVVLEQSTHTNEVLTITDRLMEF